MASRSQSAVQNPLIIPDGFSGENWSCYLVCPDLNEKMRHFPWKMFLSVSRSYDQEYNELRVKSPNAGEVQRTTHYLTSWCHCRSHPTGFMTSVGNLTFGGSVTISTETDVTHRDRCDTQRQLFNIIGSGLKTKEWKKRKGEDRKKTLLHLRLWCVW